MILPQRYVLFHSLVAQVGASRFGTTTQWHCTEDVELHVDEFVGSDIANCAQSRSRL